MIAELRLMRGWASLLTMLALSGCMAATDRSPTPRWWLALDDPEMSTLIERRLPASATMARSDHAGLAARIASRYIELRAKQTALVLLAEREDLQQSNIARQCALSAARRCRAVATLHLAATRAGQARTRADIAALRGRLTMMTASPRGTLDSIPGGPIPLPPEPGAGDVVTQRLAEWRRYQAARQTEAKAQLRVLRTRTAAVTHGDTIAADLHALTALQAEERSRAAMTRAYVALER